MNGPHLRPVRNMQPAGVIIDAIVQLAREASIEINVADVKHLEVSRTLLARGTKIYVSHLPRQHWDETIAACAAVRAAGFDPVPHVPVRLLDSEDALDRLVTRLRQSADELLVISGDYSQPAGPFGDVMSVLRSGVLQRDGFKRLSFAGHPEGHPSVPLRVIRNAEREKVHAASASGIAPTLVTQFFFEHEPFLQWSRELREQGVDARLIGGLAGPARISTLFKYAMRCGVGPSIRALGVRPSSVMKLMGDRGPELPLRGLAEARVGRDDHFTGIHLFCFGGYLRTCQWLHQVTTGAFRLDDQRGFVVEG